ncbi:hypothetical protein SALBM311S_00345 [Streptomyces alboniger]
MKLRKVTAASAAVLALALTATACGGDDSKDSSSGSSGGGKIKIGIKYDQPGLGLKEPDGSFSGFDVDVATYVAKELGYKPDQIEWVETKSADRRESTARPRADRADQEHHRGGRDRCRGGCPPDEGDDRERGTDAGHRAGSPSGSWC